MTDKMKSFVKGLMLSLCKPFSKKSEPVAYLYNGVRLPKLPEWDRGVYPYAVIFNVGSITTKFYRVYCNDAPFYVGAATGMVTALSCSSITSPIDTSATEWPTETVEHAIYSAWPSEVLWSNHDILNEDGTICIAASDPVPVYE